MVTQDASIYRVCEGTGIAFCAITSIAAEQYVENRKDSQRGCIPSKLYRTGFQCLLSSQVTQLDQVWLEATLNG